MSTEPPPRIIQSGHEPDLEYVTQGASARTTNAIYNYFNAQLAALEKAMLIGDERLADHIAQQIDDIRSALATAERLELERVEGLRREISISSEASKEAILKQEAANEKRFEGVNQFRAQLATQQQTFMPREVVEKQIEAVEERLMKVESRLDRGEGHDFGKQESKVGLYALLGAVVAVITTVIVLANVVTSP